MNQYKIYLDKIGEIGTVEKVFQSLVYVRGLPHAQFEELVIFENGEIGQVLSLHEDYVEVMLLSRNSVDISSKVTRTNSTITIPVGDFLMRKTISPLGPSTYPTSCEKRRVRPTPLGIQTRKNIHEPFVTGVSLVDMVVPLGKGQRQLVVGDRKSGKTEFLLQCAESAINQGIICIYAAIAKKQSDIVMIEKYFSSRKMDNKAVIVATGSSEPAPLIYLTPYSAMTVAEYFRDNGHDTLVIFDDMTAHAKYYRELTLLAKRFPGRSSYPGDIFYIHAQLMERAGNYMIKVDDTLEKKEVSITCLPVAELVMSDLSGYIQTNLMSMTDGHIFFDNNLYNEGRRPAVNASLSVTRVGRQAQTPLVRDISREISSFLVRLSELEQFMHFGAELSEESKADLKKGDLLRVIFNQKTGIITPLPISVILIASVWAQMWRDNTAQEFSNLKQKMLDRYKSDLQFKQEIDQFINSSTSFDILVNQLIAHKNLVLQ